MEKKRTPLYIYYLISLLVIAIDQVVKMAVHFNMDLGAKGQIKIFGDWFKLHYLTNPGMAFGMQIGFIDNGKLVLTLFRLAAMVAIGYYLYTLYKKETSKGLLICIAMILGGAIGNLVDSIFYGVFLDNAPYDAPTPWFYGQVVDMFYIDIWEGRIADWVPILGGDYMALWPVFNIADASIFMGITFILIFQKSFFGHETESSDQTEVKVEP
ncbi:lipoprotein signal peptidase [Marinoscillum sp. 108]|jgi:signal peptidase II|uniref:Lipoprotein signal peptidase n=1 Tax=Marinoscillum luteum TaxID=861051 RepID=A0ABW7NCB8_9BACT|nr:lipoprotein signal peptidase [Marinoscillum sp. 108]VXD18957.1 Lipoprotein signal peptidase [Marinoscillum sp. 108]